MGELIDQVLREIEGSLVALDLPTHLNYQTISKFRPSPSYNMNSTGKMTCAVGLTIIFYKINLIRSINYAPQNMS